MNMRNPFVFLFGCPRSGTTLMRRMVNAHRQVGIVPEIRWLSRRFALREGLTPDGHLTPEFFRNLRDFGRFTHIPLEPAEIAEFARADRAVSYAAFLSALFDAWGRKHGKQRVGQKNADHAVPTDIETLHALWPDAKFVHLIRDGRDVCLSVLNWRIKEKVGRLFSTWDRAPVATLAAWWEWQVRLWREAGAALGPDQYMEVRYESMVRRPDETCARLCAFMGVPFDDRMSRFYENPPVRKAKQAWLPPTPGRRDWHSEMPLEDQERFEAVAGDLLDELGYVRVTDRISAPLLEDAESVRAAFELRPLPRLWLAATGTNARSTSAP
jgi:hypothetical protein